MQIIDMQTRDRVCDLARKEAQRIKKFKTIEEEEEDRIDKDHPPVPRLQITLEGRGKNTKYTLVSFGEKDHPNEARMNFLKDYFSLRILNNLEEGADPSGVYRVQLHDSCTYLSRGNDYCDVLTFGRDGHAKTALLADPYLVSGFADNMLGSPDTLPWISKASKVIFAGSTTGDIDPILNTRVKACVWALDHQDVTDFRITSVVQMNPFDVQRKVPQMKYIIAPHIAPNFQFKFKFIANIMGNTACWSRVPMILKSQSVMFHVPHEDVTWYSSLIKNDEHYVACETFDEFLTNRIRYTHLPMECARITDNANQFVKSYLSPDMADSYTTSLLCSVEGA